MAIDQRNYYYIVRGRGDDNTLEKVLKLHGIRKTDGSDYNTSYRHDPEAWEFIKRARSENSEILSDPMIWKGSSREKHLNLWKIEPNDPDNIKQNKVRNIRNWCRPDVNPPASAPLEHFWDNDSCRFYGRASSDRRYHLIIYVGERIWIPDDQQQPQPEPEREWRRHELTDDELINGFIPPDNRYNYELMFPVIRVQLEIDTDEPFQNTDKFTLFSTDENHFYRQTLLVQDNESEYEEYLDLHFQGTPYSLNYSLEFEGANGRRYFVFENVPGTDLREDPDTLWDEWIGEREGPVPGAIINLKWMKNDREVTHAMVGETVTMYAETVDVPNGDPVTIKLYEYDYINENELIRELQTRVQDGKIRQNWVFEYHPDPNDLGSDNEQYSKPEYIFVVESSRHDISEESVLLELQDWIELEFINDETNQPLADVEYTLRFADGTERRGRLNGNGFAREENVPPGEHEIIIGNDEYDIV